MSHSLLFRALDALFAADKRVRDTQPPPADLVLCDYRPICRPEDRQVRVAEMALLGAIR